MGTYPTIEQFQRARAELRRTDNTIEPLPRMRPPAHRGPAIASQTEPNS
jgi:hypothetical protein